MGEIPAFRAGELEGYRFYNKSYTFSFIAVSSLPPTIKSMENLLSVYEDTVGKVDKKKTESILSKKSKTPQLSPAYSPLNQQELSLLHTKLQSFLIAAAKHGHDSVIIPAFGCHTNGYNPKEISAAIASVLSSFKGVFRFVVFAIPPINDSNDEYVQVASYFYAKKQESEKQKSEAK